jgi:hypothetical protein
MVESGGLRVRGCSRHHALAGKSKKIEEVVWTSKPEVKTTARSPIATLKEAREKIMMMADKLLTGPEEKQCCETVISSSFSKVFWAKTS